MICWRFGRAQCLINKIIIAITPPINERSKPTSRPVKTCTAILLKGSVKEKAKTEGNDSLYEMLKQVDTKSTEKIHKNNVKRVIRALEFYKLNGYPISEHNEKEAAKTSPYNFAYFVLNHKRDILYDRINRRVDIMAEQGLIDEVKRLKEEGYEKTMVSMQGIGYRQVFEYLEGNLSLEDTIEQIKKDTRHFAKRQLTWFGREKEVCMVDKSQFGSEDEILTYMLTILKEKGIKCKK